MVNQKLRGIKDPIFLEKLNNSRLMKVVRKHDDLIVGIRNNSINIYSHGASIAKVTDGRTKLKIEIASHYLDLSLKNVREYIDEDCWCDLVEKGTLQRHSYDYHKSKEKDVQQKLMLCNNLCADSKWYCVDMEYNSPRQKEKDPAFGRFDVIAVSKEAIDGRNKIALIELKIGSAAYSGLNYPLCTLTQYNFLDHAQREFIDNGTRKLLKVGSGIVGHLCDYIRFKRYITEYCQQFQDMKDEICNMVSDARLLNVNNAVSLSNINLNNTTVDDIQIYFITLKADCNTKVNMRQNLFLADERIPIGKYEQRYPSAEKVLATQKGERNSWTIGKTKDGFSIFQNGQPFLGVTTLFSQDTASSLDNCDIINNTKYSKGL